MRFYHPRSGQLIRASLDTHDEAKAELLRQRIELQTALLAPRFQAADIPADIQVALGLPGRADLGGGDLPVITRAAPCPSQPPLVAAQRHPLDRALQMYMAHIRSENAALHIENKVSILRRFLGDERVAAVLGFKKTRGKPSEGAFFKGEFLDELTPALLQEFMGNLPVSTKTKRHYREFFHHFFEFSLKFGYFQPGNWHCPNLVAALPSYVKKNRHIVFLTAAQVDEQLQALEPYPAMHLAVAVMIFAGLRRAEILWLAPDHIASDHSYLSVVNRTDSDEDIDGDIIVVRDPEGTLTTQEPLPDPRGEQIWGTLSTGEQSDLKRLVGRFQKLQGAWYEGLEILWEIKSRRLYRQDHSSFEAFCRKVFGVGKSNINRSLRSAEVAKHLATNVAKPERESHIRPLLKLMDADEQVDCYRAARDAAQSAKRPMNAKDVTKAVQAKLPSRSSGSESPSEPTAADVITRLGRSVIRGLESHPVDVLVRFAGEMVRFKDDWFANNLPSSYRPVPTTGTTDAPDTDDVAETVAAVDLTSVRSVASISEHASGETQASEGSHVSRAQDRQREVDHAPQPRRKYDVIALHLEPGATAERLKALRLDRLMQNCCHVFIKLNGNPSQFVENAFAGSVRQVHGCIRLVPSVVTDQGQDKHAGTETVVVVLNGYAKVKKCIPADVTCTVADDEQWLEAVLSHHSELFPAGLPKRILSLTGTSVSTPAESPRDAGEDQQFKGDVTRSTEAGVASQEGGESSHE